MKNNKKIKVNGTDDNNVMFDDLFVIWEISYLLHIIMERNFLPGVSEGFSPSQSLRHSSIELNL